MMDYLSYNRAHLNNRRLYRINNKVMVFIVPSVVKVGVVPTELCFPYKGEIVDAYATCGTTGSGNTVIDVEKCSQIDYDTSPVWASVFEDKLVIDANRKSSNTSTSPYKFDSTQITVNEGDHFRINVIETGGVENLTVELIIDLYIEE